MKIKRWAVQYFDPSGQQYSEVRTWTHSGAERFAAWHHHLVPSTFRGGWRVVIARRDA